MQQIVSDTARKSGKPIKDGKAGMGKAKHLCEFPSMPSRRRGSTQLLSGKSIVCVGKP